MATPILNLRVDLATKDRWQQEARDRGYNLADFIRSCVEAEIGTPGKAEKPAASRAKRKSEKASAACPQAHFHRPGTWCKTCEEMQ